MKYTATMDDTLTRAYSRLLLRLHDLIAKGQGDAPEGDAVRDQVGAPWYAMTAAEQERVGGLSEDLYALAENRPRSVKMSAEARWTWGEEARAGLAGVVKRMEGD